MFRLVKGGVIYDKLVKQDGNLLAESLDARSASIKKIF